MIFFPSKSLFLATKKDIESLALRVASAPNGLTSVSRPFSVQWDGGSPLRCSSPHSGNLTASWPRVLTPISYHSWIMSSPPNASCEGRKVPTTGPLGHWALSALQWRPRRQQAAHLLRPFFDWWPYSDHYFIILFNYSCLQFILGSLLWICYYYYNFLSIIFCIWFWIFFTYGIPSHKFLTPPLTTLLNWNFPAKWDHIWTKQQ